MPPRTHLGDLGPTTNPLIEESLRSVRDALANLRFGQVSLTVHEGKVVQIDVTEKRRLQSN